MSESPSLPQVVTTIPQSFIIEALGGPQNPAALLDTFPDAIYHKSPESHLVRFLYALLGPVGIGQIAKNYLDARLALEEMGLELFDLDSFFGNPFAFGRILEESYDDSTGDLLDTAAQARVRARDSQYRNRAIDFLGGVRLGNSPEGMRLVAKAGLGHDVEIVENYKYLYDIHSDDPQGYTSYGSTASTEEMVILPRQEISRSEVQEIKIVGSPTGGYITPLFNGRTSDAVGFKNIPYNAPARSDWDISVPATPTITTLGVQEVLESHDDIGTGNVRVTGGPGPDNPWYVEFVGELSGRDVPEISFSSTDDTSYAPPNMTLTGGDPDRTVVVTTIVGGLDGSQERVTISPRDQYHLQQAVDRIKAMTVIPTVNDATGLRSPQPVNAIYATSEFVEVVRYVTGNTRVNWPATDGTYWIERNVEKEAPRLYNASKQHYQGFHNIVEVAAYTDGALTDMTAYEAGTISTDYRSEHIGRFNPAQAAIFPVLGNTDSSLLFSADRAPADYPEQPLITSQSGDVALMQGVYPIEYAHLSGVPVVKYKDEQFWSSRERTSGDEYLEIDLGSVQVVNFVAFETLRKPVAITIAYDRLDQAPRRKFVDVMPSTTIPYPDLVSFSNEAGWTYLEFDFSDVNGDPIYTRFIRIKLSRRVSLTDPFLYDPVNNVQNPWSIEVRNLRIGRNASN